MNSESWQIIQIPGLPDLTYLVACTRTRTCAVVNPSPATDDEVHHQLNERGLTARFWLHPRSTTVSPGPEVAPDPHGPALSAGHDAMILRAGQRRIGVRRFRGPALTSRGPSYTIGGSRPRNAVPTHIAARARVAVGAGFLDILPVAHDELVFRLAGHLFTGRAATHTPSDVLDHDPNTLVHPGLLADGLFISSVAQETFRRTSAARVARAHPLPPQPTVDEALSPIDVG